MKRTLNNTATAKKIAADCGLVFSYVRGARIWRLTSKDFAAVRRVYDAKNVPNVEVDAFYLDCQYVASQTVTPEQMNTVVERARYSAMQERLNCGEEFAPGSADALEFMRLFNAAYTHDRHVWEVENAIHRLLEELEEQHGTYADHKAAHAAQVEEVETIVAQPVADLVAVASYANGAHVGLSINGRFVLSFPACLVDGAIPNLQEAEWILTGAEVKAACWRFNVARACRVSLAKPEAPECVCVLADVPQESNAVVMARAVAFVRDIRLTREYLAAHDDTGPEWEFFGYAARGNFTWSVWRYADASGFVYQVTQSEDAPTGDGGYRELLAVLKLRQLTMCDGFPGSLVACEMKRALDAEQARADAARNLARGN